MTEAPETQITQMLIALDQGDEASSERLLELLYKELHELAGARMANLPPGNTLQATALVHEAYIKLVRAENVGWTGRAHFFGAAASAMRDILGDQARRKAALKHGGEHKRIDPGSRTLDGQTDVVSPEEMVAIDEALTKLESLDERKARVVALRFFAGLTNEQIAQALDVSLPTLERDWRFARSWLHLEMTGDSQEPAGP